MPRVSSQKVSRLHPTAPGSSGKSAGKRKATDNDVGGGGNRATNPIFTKDLGQHILKNPLVAQSIIDKANLRPTDHVLEVGPGTGNLTMRILEKGVKKVTAVEMDPRLAAEVMKRVQGKPEQRRLELIVGDFVKQELPYFDACISNTPYQISSPLVFKLLSQRPLPRICILMFQREFALRLCARPSTTLWCRLSANVQLYSKVSHVLKLSKNNFRPPPKVESSVIRLVPIDPPPEVEFGEFDGLTRVIFGRKNKTCRANFGAKGVKEMMEGNWKAVRAAKNLPFETIDISKLTEEVLTETGYAEERAAKMDVEDFLKLLQAFHARGVHFS